jgi:FtsZ-binding cell division protein ZapB
MKIESATETLEDMLNQEHLLSCERDAIRTVLFDAKRLRAEVKRSHDAILALTGTVERLREEKDADGSTINDLEADRHMLQLDNERLRAKLEGVLNALRGEQ